MRRVGFVGLGQIGFPLCLNLARAGGRVIAYDLNVQAERRTALENAGARVVDTLSAVAEDRDTIITVLPDSDAVNAVLLDAALEKLPDGAVCVDMSTSDPLETVRLGGVLKQRGIDLVDAPICNGGTPGAYERRNLVCAGGDGAAFEAVRSTLECFVGTLMHVGPLGTGHAVKAINNSIGIASSIVFSEGIALAVGYGLQPSEAVAVLKQCSASSQTFESIADLFLRNPPDTADFRLQLACKDIRYATVLAGAVGVPHSTTDAAHALLELAERLLGTDFDAAFAPSEMLKRLGSRPGRK